MQKCRCWEDFQAGLHCLSGRVSGWMLPKHMMVMEKFKDEATVAQAITANAPVQGVCLLLIP